MLTALAFVVACAAGQTPAESRSLGAPEDGRLVRSVELPASGEGFTTYSRLGHLAGRQYVHSRVRDALLAALATRARAERGRVFVLGETGRRGGGPLPPHRTHQNGLSVDVFMPLVDPRGQPQTMPTAAWNKFGYGLEFDREGRSGELRIDFESLAGLLLELERQAPQHGLTLRRVIIAPEYVPLLLATPTGRRFGSLAARLSRRRAWVRHDEHVHLDFALVPPPQ
jgi:penicillin-insensitive murein endopeptidase